MKKIAYALLYYSVIPFIYLFSVLPWPVLFVLSDISFIFLYYIIGYRRKIVRLNLSNSFPGKSKTELKAIEFRFYRYFTDLIFEILKQFTLSQEEKIARCKMTPESVRLFSELYAKRKSGILVMGHYGNWEFCSTGLPPQTDFQAYVIYHPLTNPYFDKLMSGMRTSSSGKLYTMAGTLKGMIANRNELNVTAFLSDQSPSSQGAHWMQFLNQDTPVYNGPEKIASKLGMAVIYGRLERVKRGRYIFHANLICENASEVPPGEITRIHTRLLEDDICNTPEYWLWTHRRWKHKRILQAKQNG